MIQFSHILDKFGGIGPSQLILFFLVSYYNISKGANSISTVFIAYIPNKRCNVPPLDNATAYPNLTEQDILNYTTSYDDGTQQYDTCVRYGYNLSTCTGDLSCVNKSYPSIACDKGYHYDDSLFTKTIITEFNLVCDRKYLNALSTSFYYIGMLVGSFLFGSTADRFGRKPTIIATFIGTLGCMVGVTFSTTVEMYTVFRTGTALFLAGASIGSFVYVIEIVPQKWVGAFGLMYQGIFTCGYMNLSALAFIWRDWHEIMGVATILSAPYLIIALVIPESPRWQFTNGKDKAAIKTTLRMARMNGVTLTDEDWTAATVDDDKPQENKPSKTYSAIDLFRIPAIRFVTVKITYIWFANSFVFYGLTLNTGALAGDIFLNNLFVGIVSLLSYLVCALVMNRLGRRAIMSGMLIFGGFGLLFSVVGGQFKDDNGVMEKVCLALAFAGRFGITGTYGVMYPFSAELYPTVLRGNGMGMGAISSRMGAILAPFVISLQDYHKWIPNTIFGCLGVMAGLVCLTFPETNGRNMMETIEEAEDFFGKKKNASKEDTASIKSNLMAETCLENESKSADC